MKIVVIGSGIAGLGAAHLLARRHHVELYERADRIGGHTNTVEVPTASGTVPVDTGFIVHNRENYPNLVRLFDELGVATQESEMSFSVSCDRCGLEYSGAQPWRQGANLLRPSFIPLMLEIVRFMRTAPRAVDGSDETLAQFVARTRYSRRFRDHFLLPLVSSLWSMAPDETGDVPAQYAVGFFANHGMLRFRRFRWRTVVGGSRSYVRAILDRFPGDVHVGEGVQRVVRTAHGVAITTDRGRTVTADGVVVATHAPQALQLLADPSDDERRLLGAFTTTLNETVLHSDPAMIPRRRRARGAWNYRIADCQSPDPVVSVTYDLGRLQRLEGPSHYLVSLNRGSEIGEAHVMHRINYAHPRYTAQALAAQRELGLLAGVRNTWFCGAWQGNGFHEDGFVSAIRVARALGVDW